LAGLALSVTDVQPPSEAQNTTTVSPIAAVTVTATLVALWAPPVEPPCAVCAMVL
jgi:hypothetical protein